MKPRVPHAAWPPRLDANGHLVAVEQDTLEEVTQCVRVLLATPRGARVLEPEFGIEDPTFTDGLDIDELVDQAAEYEERAVIDVTEVVNTDTGESTTRLLIDLA